MSERIQEIVKELRRGKKRLSHIAWENALNPGSKELLDLSKTCVEAADLIESLQLDTYRNSTQVTGYCPICAERAKQEQREPEPEPLTYRGYDAGLLEIAYGLVRSEGISPDDLRRCVDNFKQAAKIYSEHMQKSIMEATIKLVKCGVVEFINPTATEPKGEPNGMGEG